jgi:hypothetical protein
MYSVYRLDPLEAFEVWSGDGYLEALEVVLKEAAGEEIAPMQAPAVARLALLGKPVQAWRILGGDLLAICL